MAIKLALSSKEILNKVFPQAPRGYDGLAVDEFLDKILSDYRLVEANNLLAKEEIDDLKARIAQLEEQNKTLELQNASYENKLKNIKTNDTVSRDNINLIKKINTYEKFLWNNGFNPNTIK